MDRETSGSPTPPPQSASINQAIEDAPLAELKRLVQNLWADLPQSHTLIDAALRRPLGKSRKLKRKAFETCKNCHETYDVGENEMGMCRYHPCEFMVVVPSLHGYPLTSTLPYQWNRKWTMNPISGQIMTQDVMVTLFILRSWRTPLMRMDISWPAAKRRHTSLAVSFRDTSLW